MILGTHSVESMPIYGMLRYAIEKFHEKDRKRCLLGLILAEGHIKDYQKEYLDDYR